MDLRYKGLYVNETYLRIFRFIGWAIIILIVFSTVWWRCDGEFVCAGKMSEIADT